MNPETEKLDVLILISANAEWKSVLSYYHEPTVHSSPFGTYFHTTIASKQGIVMHGGWGKVSAAASTQFGIDSWHPRLIINIGTCGGFEGMTKVGETLLVDETLIYDIYERMEDPELALNHYKTTIDLSYLCEPFPQKVHIGRLVSADQDIDPDLVFKLQGEYNAIAADWESGAIAWTAQHNLTKILILRGVSDLVNSMEGEIYKTAEFSKRAEEIMIPLLKTLPNWVRCASWGNFT